MSHLTDEQILSIKSNVSLLSIKDVDDISHYSFDSQIKEYNDFLGIADKFYDIADIEYDHNTPLFYKKNGFVENLNNKSRNAKYTISMRKDIFSDN